MISFFRIQNYKSIVDTTIDMRFDEGKAPNGYKDSPEHIFLESARERVVPVQVIYGANASGKTCIVSAIETFVLVLSDGVGQYRYNPNRLNQVSDCTTFTLQCLVSSHRCEYALAYDGRRIRKESLYVDGALRFEVSDDALETNIDGGSLYDGAALRSIFGKECFGIEGSQRRTFLSVLASNYTTLDPVVSNVFFCLFGSLFVLRSNSVDQSKAFGFYCAVCTTLSDPKGVDECRESVLSVVRNLDISISDLSFDKEMGPGTGEMSFLNWKALHLDVGRNPIWFDFNEESDGTKRLVGLVSCILGILEVGGMLVVDEIDCSLHSSILSMVIKLFKDKRYNTKGAQLLCTAHNTDLLDNQLLRVSEVGIIDKNTQEGSRIRRLSQIDGVRNVSNFRKQYLDGLYSGIPFPYI